MFGVITAVLFLLAALLLLCMVHEAFRNRVKIEELSFPDFPAECGELAVFFISDIHRRLVHESIIQRITNAADLVIIGGDLTEGGVPLPRTRLNLERLREAAPVYFVWGNNDREVNQKELNLLFQEYGVTVLKNEAAFFQKGKGEIALIGLDDEPSESIARAILHSLDGRSFKILVCHRPFGLKQIIQNDHTALILSGHTHGGQIRFFGIGPYRRGKTHHFPNGAMIVSNGYGTTLFPLRLGAPAETHLITIKHAKE